MIKSILALLLASSCALHAFTIVNGTNVVCANGTPAEVQAGINAAQNGWVVDIPAGNHTWVQEVSIPGSKYIHLRGAGCWYLLGYSETPTSPSVGEKTFQTPVVLGTHVGQTVTVGQTLFVGWKADDRVFMQGTVSSYNGSSLVMNITSVGASPDPGTGGNKAAWYFRTVNPATTINCQTANTAAYNQQLDITESASGNTTVSGIHWTLMNYGSGSGCIGVTPAANGKAVVIHNSSFTGAPARGGFFIVYNSPRGLIYKCSADCGWFSNGAGTFFAAFQPEFLSCDIAVGNSTAWTTAPTYGAADVNGDKNFYVENCYIGGIYRTCTDLYDVKLVFRYSMLDNAGLGSHGWEASNKYSVRFVDLNNCRMIVDNMGSFSYPGNWYYLMRGGTLVMHNNFIKDWFTSAYGHKAEVLVQQHSLYPGHQHTDLCSSYPFPQQVGGGYNGSAYVIEPAYEWNNTKGPDFNIGVDGQLSTLPGNESCSTAVIFQQNREYFLNTAKPGYTPFTYPHPLAGGSPPPPATNPPSITVQPSNATVVAGEPATFSVVADGAPPLTYIWRTNGVAIAGATVSGYTFNPTVLAHSGYQLTVIVGNSYGSVTSSVATLTVNNPPSAAAEVSVDPVSITRTVGENATFTVTATGDLPITYQWQTNGGGGYVNVGGATSSSYAIAAVALVQNGWLIRCAVANAHGSDTSAAATLTVNAPPEAEMRYVDQSAGNDSNPGTEALPWKHCPGMVDWAGQATLTAGDVVYFDRSDTWSMPATATGCGLDLAAGVHYIGDEWDPEAAGPGKAKLQAAGNIGAGCVRWYHGDHATIASIFEGFDVDANATRSDGIGINYPFFNAPLAGAIKRIQDCVVRGVAGNGSEGDFKYGIAVSDNTIPGVANGLVRNIEIIGCTVTNFARDGIVIYPGPNGHVDGALVRGCTVWGLATDPSYAEGSGIGVKGHVRNVSLIGNYVHDVEAAAVFISGAENYNQDTASYGPSNVVVVGNILGVASGTSNDGVIRWFDPATNPGASGSLDVFGNIILPDVGIGGFSMAGAKGTNKHIRVYNNTFVHAKVDVGNPTLTSSTIDFRNNIIVQSNAIPFTDAGTDVTTHSHNVYYRTDGGVFASQGGNSYTTANILSWESTALTNDPVFLNIASLPTGFTGTYGVDLTPNTTGLQLDGASPAIDSGVALGVAFSSAISSAIRSASGSDNKWDRGAYEQMVMDEPTPPPPPPVPSGGVRTGTILILQP